MVVWTILSVGLAASTFSLGYPIAVDKNNGDVHVKISSHCHVLSLSLHPFVPTTSHLARLSQAPSCTSSVILKGQVDLQDNVNCFKAFCKHEVLGNALFPSWYRD